MPEEILVPDWHTWDCLYWMAVSQLSTQKVLFLGIPLYADYPHHDSQEPPLLWCPFKLANRSLRCNVQKHGRCFGEVGNRSHHHHFVILLIGINISIKRSISPPLASLYMAGEACGQDYTGTIFGAQDRLLHYPHRNHNYYHCDHHHNQEHCYQWLIREQYLVLKIGEPLSSSSLLNTVIKKVHHKIIVN